MVKKGFRLWIFPPDVVPFQSKEVVGAFLAHGRQYGRMGLVYFVTSPQCFIHARNKRKHREIALFFHTMPNSCIVFGWHNKSDSENGRALPRIPFFLRSSPGVSEKKEKKWIDFAISHGLCLFRGRMKLWGDVTKKLFRQSNQDSSERLLMWKTFWGLVAL